ncbi:DUF1329 domain-containing protein [Pseudomonas koreensis]|uniref:DUF1329 domain-containing protein n=1 Tax=Pseudomonas koreensis TaxID=198620 RepID=A0A9X2XLB3_9PSED|nr:DUF1329 domain-containing protein [Pseudomonas koreensis]MCU7250896.1 DUF1329 domain-containing protein [Pseudomonas koreensis]
MNLKRYALSCALLCGVGSAVAAVPADQAARLQKDLTPLGGERAGNASGTIPAWSGGQTEAVAGPSLGDIPTGLFGNEKPLLRIDASNLEQHRDKLSDGTIALMKKYPTSFRIDVYPTHRTAAAPSWVYRNTAQNAASCQLADGAGPALKGCYGGTPFPIPQNGREAIWNWLLRLEPSTIDLGFKNIVVTPDGSRTLASRNDEAFQFPYYYADGNAEKWSGEYFMVRFSTTAPSFKVGESLVIRDSIDSKVTRQAWQYLVGQRRVRRAPTVGYDTPDFVASGANYFDEVCGFQGFPDRYEWKLVGKKEMYVPYNTNAFQGARVDDAFTGNHLNPDKLRWELHRVWEVEANVSADKRHAVPKRRFYLDEDTWMLTLMDGYDAKGNLWRTSQVPSFVVPKLPGVVMMPSAVYNLQAGTLSLVQLLNEENYKVAERKPEIYFTGDAVASDALR